MVILDVHHYTLNKSSPSERRKKKTQSQWLPHHHPSSQSRIHKPPPPPADLPNPKPPTPPTPTLRAFISHITNTIRNDLSYRRPWSVLADRSAFSKPDSISEASLRIRKNYSYFRVNYLSTIAIVLAFSLLTNHFSLITLHGLLSAWLFLYLFRPSDSPLVVFGCTFFDRETLGILLVSSIVVIFLTSVGSIMILALLVGLAIVYTHGVFRVPEDLFLNKQEPVATGFLSFLADAPSNSSSADAPTVIPTRAWDLI